MFKRLQTGLLLGALLISSPAAYSATAINDLPPDSVKIPPMVKEQSVSTFVPTEDGRIAVNMIYGAKARYKAGAPVAVVVPGGTGADGLGFDMHAAQEGFIEVRFAFPGGGTPEFGSSGKIDNRGEESIKALRDVILFAAGIKKDYKERTIKELMAAHTKVDTASLGLVGWDNGGNQALVVLGKYPEELQVVSWLAFYESPVGAMFYPPNLGSQQDLLLNKHYREGSAATGNLIVDYRKLAWTPDAFRNPNRYAGKKRGMLGLKGVLFFDENGNGVWEESREFAFTSILNTELTKQYFPPQVTAACERLKVFGEKWPANVAKVAESEEFFEGRDGSLYIAKVAKEYPRLLVGLFASAVDHSQQQTDHPHIVFLYNLFLENKVRWLRLNADATYMAQVSKMNEANFVSNKPNSSIDASTLLTHLEPEGISPDYVFMLGLICEMSDRAKTRNLKDLTAPILNYTNGAIDPLAKAKDEIKDGEAKNK